MKHNPQEQGNQKFKLFMKRVFIENWPLKVGAVIAAFLIWMCIGYLFQ